MSATDREPDAAPVALAWLQVATLRAHPLAAELPTLSEPEFEALKADIAQHGVQVALEVSAEGVVLDGHLRLQAARELGIGWVPVQVIAPEDESEHILRRTLIRRSLSASQKAAVALRLAPYEEMRRDAACRQRANLRGEAEVATLPAREGRTRDLVAELAGASPRTVQDVITVHDHDPALFERVLHNQVSASSAARKVRRARRDAAIPPAPPLPEGPFPLLYGDPPWQMGSPDSPHAPEQHYPTMPLHEIKALKVPAAENAILFLWAVTSLLPEALEVLEAWGFTYRSAMVWVKNGIGLGTWVRHRHELLLIATKGAISPPDPEDRCDSVIEASRGLHSEKPLEAYERIERMYPQLPKLELFGRGTPRPGWQIWGNQAQPDPEPSPDSEPESEPG